FGKLCRGQRLAAFDTVWAGLRVQTACSASAGGLGGFRLAVRLQDLDLDGSPDALVVAALFLGELLGKRERTAEAGCSPLGVMMLALPGVIRQMRRNVWSDRDRVRVVARGSAPNDAAVWQRGVVGGLLHGHATALFFDSSAAIACFAALSV